MAARTTIGRRSQVRGVSDPNWLSRWRLIALLAVVVVVVALTVWLYAGISPRVFAVLVFLVTCPLMALIVVLLPKHARTRHGVLQLRSWGRPGCWRYLPVQSAATPKGLRTATDDLAG